MTWVRSEYAGEFAVVAAWLAALLPWNVTYATFSAGGQDGSALFLRFPLLQIRYIFGIDFADPMTVDHPLGAKALASGAPELIYDLWMAGVPFLLLALALSVGMYVAEERLIELSPIRPVRIMGALLSASALAWTAATYAVLTRGEFGGGLPIPIGLVVLLLLAGSLLTVELA